MELVCAVKPLREEEEPGERVELMVDPGEGPAAWEDDGTLQQKLRPLWQIVGPDFAGAQVDVYA